MSGKHAYERKLQLHGFSAVLIIAAGLILNFASFFIVWASTSNMYIYLLSETLTLPRILLQASIILGWIGIIIHQFYNKGAKIAYSMWTISFILSILTIPLTLDSQMNLCEGAYVSVAGSIIIILGTFLDISRFEIVIEVEEAQNK